MFCQLINQIPVDFDVLVRVAFFHEYIQNFLRLISGDPSLTVKQQRDTADHKYGDGKRSPLIAQSIRGHYDDNDTDEHDLSVIRHDRKQ